jgi:hypothetical protein
MLLVAAPADVAELARAVQALADSRPAVPESPWYATLLVALVGAVVGAAVTYGLALLRDRATWAKEVQRGLLQEALGRVGELLEWVHRGAVRPYPHLAFLYLQLHLRSLGAADLLPDLADVRQKAAKLDRLDLAARIAALRGREDGAFGPPEPGRRERDTQARIDSEAELDRRVRDLKGDLVFFGVRINNHVAKDLGLSVHPCSREDIDA